MLLLLLLLFFVYTLDPRRLLKWLIFRPMHASLALFTDLQKSDHVITNFRGRVMSESPAVGEIASQFV